MNKNELLTELDLYLATMNEPTAKWTVGEITCYSMKGAMVRANNIAQFFDITFYVYREGLPGENAFYSGDLIGAFWRCKLEDYLITSGYIYTIFRTNKPKAVCRIIETAAIGEKWVLVTEDPSDVWQVEDIVSDIIIDI